MEKITAKEAALKWNTSVRRVQDYCKLGKIPGAELFGKNWMIPADALRPVDGRRREARNEKEQARELAARRPLVRKSPFLNMTDLYNEPGKADACVNALSYHPEARTLFEAEIAYSRGEIDKVYQYAKYFLENHTGFYSVISGGMLLGLCAMWNGDLELWKKARRHIYEAPCKNDADRDIVALSLAATDSAIRDTEDFPEWFKKGCFEQLPYDAQPAAWVYYTKYLMIHAQDLMLGKIKMENVQGMGLLKTIPYIAEPLIARAYAENLVLVEIYLRLTCGIAYQQIGERERATKHLDKAIALALPDRLYGPLVEHRRQLGVLLDERLMMADPAAAKAVKELHKQLHVGWTKLHNAVLERSVEVSLSQREREGARLAAFGLTNAEIAARMDVSEHSVKALLTAIRNKTGVVSRADLGAFV